MRLGRQVEDALRDRSRARGARCGIGLQHEREGAGDARRGARGDNDGPAPRHAKESPLGYTDQQRAAFKDAYAKRLRQQLLMIVLLFAVMVPLPFIEGSATFFGLSGAVLGPISRFGRCSAAAGLRR